MDYGSGIGEATLFKLFFFLNLKGTKIILEAVFNVLVSKQF